VAALFKTDEPKNGFFNGASYRKETVILKDGRFLPSKSGRDVSAFFLAQHDSFELFVNNMILVGNSLSVSVVGVE